MKLPKVERRKYERYDTETKISFHIKYNLKTEVSFKLVKKKTESVKEYKGITRDVSVEGLRFSSHKKLKIADKLSLKLYLPRQKKPICMTGEVRWSRKLAVGTSGRFMYDASVKLLTLRGRMIPDTIYFDRDYNVYWSVVLNSIFGNFKKIIKKIKISKAVSV